MRKSILTAVVGAFTLFGQQGFAHTCYTLEQKIGKSDLICIDHQELDFRQSFVLEIASRYQSTTSIKIDDRAGLKDITGAKDFSNSTATAVIIPFKFIPVQIAMSGDDFELIVNPSTAPVVIKAHGQFEGVANVGGAMPISVGGLVHQDMFELMGVVSAPHGSQP